MSEFRVRVRVTVMVRVRVHLKTKYYSISMIFKTNPNPNPNPNPNLNNHDLSSISELVSQLLSLVDESEEACDTSCETVYEPGDLP
jgi:hypothetical protein